VTPALELAAAHDGSGRRLANACSAAHSRSIPKTLLRQPGTDCVNYLPTGGQYAQGSEGTPFDHGFAIHQDLELANTATNHLNVSL
jgi:hypothetical protein